jgi:hypothetical protein
LAAIEGKSPLFFGDMPVDDATVRDIFAASMAELTNSSEFERATPKCRELSLLATLTHAMLETACLRYQLHGPAQAAAGDARRLLSRIATH